MTKSGSPRLIEASGLSIAWGHVLSELTAPGCTEISPLTLSITGFDDEGYPLENQNIRAALDHWLEITGKRGCENVAFTIFPERYYLLAQGNRAEFFEMYREAFQRIQKLNPQNNKKGSYFQRLIDFEGGGKGFNQLEWILAEYERRPSGRRSRWQATTFDPHRDVSRTSLQEFPCLQQVSFTFSETNGLIVNAFYATQQIIRKGYGNYLGLSRLGRFMAHEMGLKMERLNVFVGVAQADDLKKTDPDFLAMMAVINAELQNAPVLA